jgi:hypothetical protein
LKLRLCADAHDTVASNSAMLLVKNFILSFPGFPYSLLR